MTETRLSLALRRVVDVSVAVVALVPLSPVMVGIAVLIRRDSAGSAIFKQRRVGLHGRDFVMYKFRTMRVDSSGGPGVTAQGDTRVTALGRRLRSAKLDELPQLVNVVKGDMSLVGPRPELPVYVREWPSVEREIVLSVRPGITDPMTMELRREEELLASVPEPEQYYRTVLLPRKVDAYVAYVRSRSLIGDLRILMHTLRAVVFD